MIRQETEKVFNVFSLGEGSGYKNLIASGFKAFDKFNFLYRFGQ